MAMSIAACQNRNADAAGDDGEQSPPPKNLPTSDSPAGAALFAEGSGPTTPDSMLGLWTASEDANGVHVDARLRLSATSFTMAARVKSSRGTSPICGVTGAARVSNDDLQTLEVKTDERGAEQTCSLATEVDDQRPCQNNVVPGCFKLSGTTLSFYDENYQENVWVKLSD